MTTHDAKAYLANREIPQLFESLMTGLMYYRPEDHIAYLQECLQKVQEQGVESVRWNLFIDQRRKTPLPPISGGNGRSQTPVGYGRHVNQGGRRIASPTQDIRSLDERSKALPPISPDRLDTLESPACPIVLVMGGPGSGKATQCERLTQRYQGWVHLSMGDLLRKQTFDNASPDDKWNVVGQLISKGEMAPEDMTLELLKTTLHKHRSAAGIIIEGYPRNMAQVEELDRAVSHVDLAFVLDCEEQYLQQRLLMRGEETNRVDDNMKAITNRINFFKENTLPVIKHYDDHGKVVIVDGDRDCEEIFYDLSLLFDHTFYPGHDPGNTGAAPVGPPRPPSGPKPRSARPGSTRYNGSRPGSRLSGGGSRPSSGFAHVPRTIEVDIHDSGRNPEFAQCPLICIVGGPGTGRKALADALIKKHATSVKISAGDLLRANMAMAINDGSMAPDQATLELLLTKLREASSAPGIIIEGFPRNKEQVELFNKHIGGLTTVILLDSEASYMKKQLANQGVSQDLAARKISYFKHNTLPVMAYFDDMDKLFVANAEQDPSQLVEEVNSAVGEAIHRQNAMGGVQISQTTGDSSTIQAETDVADIQEVNTQISSQPVRLVIDVQDVGRVNGQPTCPIVAVVGSPGSGLEEYCQKIVNNHAGFVIAKSLSEVSQNADAAGIILQGFPANKADIEAFNSTVGGMSGVVVLDCTEEYARERAASQADEIPEYKSNALPVLSHYDDLSLLYHIDVSLGEESVMFGLSEAISVAPSFTRSVTDADQDQPSQSLQPTETTAESSDSKPSDSAPEPTQSTQEATDPKPTDSNPTQPADAMVTQEQEEQSISRIFPEVELLTPETADTGRVGDLPKAPIISLLGYKIEGHCQKLSEKMEGSVVIKGKTIEEIKDAIVSAADAKMFILSDFPHSKQQLEEFNSTVGGSSGLVLLDSSERSLKEAGVGEEMLEGIVRTGFPVMTHYDNQGLLQVINPEQDETEVFDDLCGAVEELLQASNNRSS